MRRFLLTRTLVVLMLAVGIFVGAHGHGRGPAKADCLYGEAYYQLLSTTRHYIIGPQACLVNTPWSVCTGTGPQRLGTATVAVEAQVWVPCAF